jgi:hypothetical protein
MTSRVVTNGYWATSDRAARRRLGPLIEAGLNELNFSTGDDHARFVPVRNVVRGLAAGLDFGLTQVLMVEDRVGREVTRQTVLDLAAVESPTLRSALEGGHIAILESPWMEFAAHGRPVRQAAGTTVNAANLALREPCKSVLTTVVVTPSERLGVCCGLPREQIPELHAGSLRDHSLRELVDRALSDFLAIWLFVEGPERILAWAAGKDPRLEWEDLYAHNCDACRAIFKDPLVMAVIRDHYAEKYNQVLMKFALFREWDAASRAE